MTRSRLSWSRIAALMALAMALAVASFDEAAVAEPLILDDGSVVETRGPWTIKGRMVVFKQANGTLSSLPLDMVDVEASEAARRERAAADATAADATAADATSPESANRPEPVLVITDKDVKRAAPGVIDDSGDAGASASDDADAGGTAAGSDAATAVAGDSPSPEGGTPAAATSGSPAATDDRVVVAAERLEVTAFRVVESARGGIEITGMLVNRGERIVTDAAVAVTLPTLSGTDETFDANMANPIIPSGGRSQFRILLPDVLSVDEDAVSFDVSGRAVRPRIVGSAPTETPDAAATEDPGGDPAGGGPEGR